MKYDLSRTFRSNLLTLTQALDLNCVDPLSITLLASFSIDETPRSRDLSMNLSETGYLTLTQTEIESCIGMLLVTLVTRELDTLTETETDTETEEDRIVNKSNLKMAIEEQVKVMQEWA
jgi:hypothetical protein